MTGTGSLSVPIGVTPARSGFSPQLTLSYDSGIGNSPYGIGWSLSLPSITCKTDKGLPTFRNRDQEESDVFILSGAEDLVPVLKQDEWGEWIKDDIERNGYCVRQYRPRVEGLFARIERWTHIKNREMHWRSITRDNVVTFYGLDDESRIFDPVNPSHIFSWLICQSFDAVGNATLYEYVPESDSGVDHCKANERNRLRTANRYLKRVYYGNRRPLLLDPCLASFRKTHVTREELKCAGWMFEVVLDYGHGHYSEEPPDERRRVFARADAGRECDPLGPVRRDPFSNYRSTFEVRTYRLCHRFLMFHHFPEELGVEDYLVRSTTLNYQQKDVGSFLTGVAASGFKLQDDGRYLKKSQPCVELEYISSPLENVRRAEFEVHEVSEEALENMPTGISGDYYRWVDLDGEGISGVLSEQANAWFYKPNLGEARFGATQIVCPKPSFTGLNSGQVQLMDIGGDGNLDLVELARPTPGFYERTLDESWEGFRTFRELPVRNWKDPNLRFVDLTGDGVADVLITEDEAIWWHPSLFKEGFGEAVRVFVPHDEERGPKVVFAEPEQTIYLADMSGDGLSDIVRIRNGEVCYWPNLGYGRFGGKVTMDNAPRFDAQDIFEQRRVQLADTDGSGTTDIIYFAGDSVHIFLNESGNSWSDARVLEEFPETHNLTSVSVVDFLGRGTACLVWSSPLQFDSPRPLRYVDLMCGRKPHLLHSVINNLGAETKLEYASSTEFYLADKAAGHPWLTHLPFPVHVVRRVETTDRISHNRFVTSYTYHHGYFDGIEREFRGFGRVEQLDAEEFGVLAEKIESSPWANEQKFSQLPPTLTKTWFHTGVFLDGRAISRHMELEYYAEGRCDRGESPLNDEQRAAMLLYDTILPPGLTPEEAREACRALKGSMLRQEVYALDRKEESRRPYTVSENNFTIQLLQPRANNLHAVFFAHARESLSFNYERKLFEVDGCRRADPRVKHTFTLEVDQYGNILQSASVGYGRRFPDRSLVFTADHQEAQEKLLLTMGVNRYTNAVNESDAYRSPLACETRSYELFHVTPRSRHLGVTNLFRFDELKCVVAGMSDGSHDLVFEDSRADGAVKSGPYRRIFQRARDLYRGNRLAEILPFGVIESLALPGENYKLVITPGLLKRIYRRRLEDGTVEDLLPNAAKVLTKEGGYVDLEHNEHWWSQSGQIFYSESATDDPKHEFAHATNHFFLPKRFRDPFGNVTSVKYDRHDLVPIESLDAIGNRTSATIDYRVRSPYLQTDPNGNQSQVAFDATGMVVGTAVMGKTTEHLGDSLKGFVADLNESTILDHLRDPLRDPEQILQQATTRLIYDLFAFQRTRNEVQPQPSAVYTLARETHASELGLDQKTKIQHSFSYSDGFTREIQKKLQAEPGPLVEGGPEMNPRWIGSGWTIFNNKGKAIRQYEPFFSKTQEFEFATLVGVSSTMFYDPVARVVATLHPNHTYEKIVFDSWRKQSWDANDTVLRRNPTTDVDVGEFFSSLPKTDYLPTWHEQREWGALGKEEQDAANKTAIHADTPSTVYFDTLGRSFLTVAHNRFVRDEDIVNECLATLTRFDIRNNQIAIIDALKREIMSYDYDMSDTRIHQNSADAGERWSLNDVSGNPLRNWDSRDHEFHFEHDAARRPTNLFLRTGHAPEKLIERIVYGEGRPNDLVLNLRTQISQQYDEAGVLTNQAFDFKGNLLISSRQFLLDYRDAEVNWQGSPELEATSFVTTLTYDALNRITSSTTPDRSVVRPRYNEANLLDRVEVNLRGAGQATPLVTAIQYNAKGQRELIAYGNAAKTKSSYDPLTFRLSLLKTTRYAGGAALQHLRYTCDPVGNITFIQDTAQEDLYFRNQAVSSSNNYTYDAVYRLIASDGREHIGQLFEPQPIEGDWPCINQPLPGDGRAMRRYRERYAYDATGNILKIAHSAASGDWTRHYEYDQPHSHHLNNRLSSTRVGELEERYTYDSDGNITRMQHLPRMEWDFKDRLHATQRQVVDGKDGQKTFYVYNAKGQRVRKVIERSEGKKSHERIYLGNFEIYREYLHEGEIKLERETLHVMDDKRRIALVETKTIGTKASASDLPTTLTRYQFTNQLDSSTLELDESSRIISYEEYYAYGGTSYESVQKGIEVSPKRYRYTGKERDEENGLYYHGARYYAPWLARWTNCDPSGLQDGSNSYVYVRNNPVKLIDPDGRQSSDELTGVGQSHHTPEQAAAARAASDSSAGTTPVSTSPGDAKKVNDDTRSPDGASLADPKKPKPDKPNEWIASVYQGVGKSDTPNATEVEANVSGAAASLRGLGKPASIGGGLNTVALALRTFADLKSDSSSFDVGATGSFSYLSSGGFGPGRFPNGASILGTAHYAWKGDNDWGVAGYASGGGAWARDPTTNKWIGPVGGGTGTLVVGHEPEGHVNYGFNLSGSGASSGQLTQGPTLANVGSVSGVASVSGDVNDTVNLSAEAYGGYSAGGGTTTEAGGTGQSASAWNAGGGVGITFSSLGPLTVLDEGTPKNQTNSVSINLNYRHESGVVRGVGTSGAPGGGFATDTFWLTVTFAFRRPPGAF